MLAGTILLRNGSEIYRVEDTMIRIAHSQGIMDCNVLAMPAAIFFLHWKYKYLSYEASDLLCL